MVTAREVHQPLVYLSVSVGAVCLPGWVAWHGNYDCNNSICGATRPLGQTRDKQNHPTRQHPGVDTSVHFSLETEYTSNNLGLMNFDTYLAYVLLYVYNNINMIQFV